EFVLKQASRDTNIAAGERFAYSMLDRILHERLDCQGRNADPAQLSGNIDVHSKPVFEPRTFNIEVGFDQIQFFSYRDEFFTGAENTAQQTRQAHQCSESAFGRRLNQ